MQLASNLSRTAILRKSVHKKFFVHFAVGAPLGAAVAYFILKEIARPTWIMFLIAAMLLYVVFKPKRLPEIRISPVGYTVLGLVAGCLGALIGATGPVLAPFFVRTDLSKESMVATKSSCQIVIHLVKIPVFLALAFRYQDHWLVIVLMVAAVILGARIGTYLLRRVSTKVFLRLIKLVMFFIACRIIYQNI